MFLVNLDVLVGQTYEKMKSLFCGEVPRLWSSVAFPAPPQPRGHGGHLFPRPSPPDQGHSHLDRPIPWPPSPGVCQWLCTYPGRSPVLGTYRSPTPTPLGLGLHLWPPPLGITKSFWITYTAVPAAWVVTGIPVGCSSNLNGSLAPAVGAQRGARAWGEGRSPLVGCCPSGYVKVAHLAGFGRPEPWI